MNILYDLEQGSDEWHELKYGKVGGTRAGSAKAKYEVDKKATAKAKKLDKAAKSVKVKKDVRENAIFDEIMGERNTFYINDEESFVSSAMQRGSDLEPLALENIEKETGIIFRNAGWLARTGYHGHSPDGISLSETIGVEIKCPSGKVHNSYVRKNILPWEHVDQVINLFAMSKKIESVWFCSFNPDYLLMPLFLIEIKRTDTITLSKTVSGKVDDLAQALNDDVDLLYDEIGKEELLIKNRIANKSKF